MSTRAELEIRREAILNQMRRIQSMKRGTLSIRPEKIRVKGEKEPVLRGPYPLFVRREGKRTVGRRLRSCDEVTRVREDIAAYERFLSLCKEYAEVTEQLGELNRTTAAHIETLKKTSKSPSKQMRK
jgi:hypothetical protein